MLHSVRRARCLVVLITLALIVHTVSCVSQLPRRELDPDATTDPTQFYRRAWHGSVLLGDTVYIDGGEFTYSTSEGPTRYPSNSSYSLDVSSSWSPDSVQLKRIDKGDSPVHNTPNMWPAPNNKSFYSINGDITLAGQHRADPPITTELWELTADGAGAGQWRRAGYATSLIGATRAKSTYGRGSAHILGGFSFDRTSGQTDFIYRTNGIVSYNIQTGVWQNRSMTPFTPAGFWIDGHLHFVDNLGGNGTVVAFGGVTADGQNQQVFMDFANIGLFNPDTGEWRNQSASGVIPPGRRLACSVGVAGDNGTYEIFVHGGSAYPNVNETEAPPAITVQLDQVWVLSIPSFTWYKSTYNAAVPRSVHTCHVPGNPPGNQMIAIGGRTPEQISSWESKDPWPQGLGIFDLTEMKWLDSYDATAGSYITPTVVKQGIARSGSWPQTWDDGDTPKWLTGKSAAELLLLNSTTSSGTNSSNNTETNGSTTHSDTPNDSSHSRLTPGILAAIAIAVTLALLAILYILARRLNWPIPGIQRKHQNRHPLTERWEKPELDSSTTMIRHRGEEMDGIPFIRYEMAGSNPAELPDEYSRRYEVGSGVGSEGDPGVRRF